MKWMRQALPIPAASQSSLDEVLPVFEFSGLQSTSIRAAPDQIFTALQQVTLSELPVARVLIGLRYWPVRWLGNQVENTPVNQPILESVLRYYQVLAEQPGRELIIGQIGRLDRIVQEAVPVSSREEFTNFNNPDYQKYALGIWVASRQDPQAVKLIIEHRLHAPGRTRRATALPVTGW